MQSTASLLLGVLALLVQPSSALVARAPVRIGAPAHGSAPLVALRRPTLVFMQAEAEEPAADAAEEAPAAAAVAAEPITKEAPAPPKDEGFDISQYSLTLSIAFLFVVVKTLSYFGIIESSVAK